MYYFNCFIIYSIFEYFLETIIAIVTKSGFKSGIMYGPWTPIYGIGVVVILLLSHYFFMNLHMPRWIETIIVFFIISIFLSCLELIGGLLIEKTFNITFWNYSNHTLNIGKYISIEMTLVWGVATVIFIYLINPILENIIKKIPSYVTIFFLIIMFSDFISTYFKLKK